MRAKPQDLDRREFDFLVIGGGIQGAALAREAALRGASVLLAERDDFGCGTSSQSSRLVHGGLRYLEHGHLRLVREALRERERLLRLAPHLVHPLPMLMPFFRDGSRRRFVLRTGLRLYDLLAGGSSLPRARSHRADDCLRLFPGLRRRSLLGGALFYDARTVDQRLTTAVVEHAAAAGALVANHLGVESATAEGIVLRDGIAGVEIRVRARRVLNVTGPAVDRVRRLLGVEGPDLVRRSRGSHLVLDPIPGETALAAFLPDRRIQFVIPHRDGTLCGTTEQEEDEGSPRILPEADIRYLLDALAWLYETPPSRADVRHGYTGWRALPTGAGPAGGANREAVLEREPAPFGELLTAVGGKLTTHRSFAERVVDRLLEPGSASPSRTAALPGGDGPREFADPLWWRHGSRAPAIRALAAGRGDLLQPICPHRDLLRVEAVFALGSQGAMTFEDLLRRRLFHSLGPCLEESCLDDVHRLFAEFLPAGARADAAADKAGLVAAVVRDRGDLGGPARP